MKYGLIRKFAGAIERNVQETERGSIPTFNDLSSEMVAEARGVHRAGGRLAACSYLLFFVREQSDGDAESFCEEVIERGADASTWNIRDCLVSVVETDREGVTLSVDRYISALDGIEGERWFFARPLDVSNRGILMAGPGPGVLVRSVRYWTRLNAPTATDVHVRRIALDHDCSVERIPDGQIDGAIRRWIASTAAWWTREYLLTEGQHAAVEGIIAAYPEPITPSVDGMIALRALVQEARSGDSRWPGQVGFIGPDDWYR